VCFAVELPEDGAGFTDDNQKWLKPAKKTKLNLSDSDDDDLVGIMLCVFN